MNVYNAVQMVDQGMFQFTTNAEASTNALIPLFVPCALIVIALASAEADACSDLAFYSAMYILIISSSMSYSKCKASAVTQVYRRRTKTKQNPWYRQRETPITTTRNSRNPDQSPSYDFGAIKTQSGVHHPKLQNTAATTKTDAPAKAAFTVALEGTLPVEDPPM